MEEFALLATALQNTRRLPVSIARHLQANRISRSAGYDTHRNRMKCYGQ
jgi:hypothetical protein